MKREEIEALADRLSRLVIMDEVGSDNPLGRDSAQSLRALAAERDQLRAENERLKEAVHHAAFVFRGYEQLHTAKGTQEGLNKAAVNATHAAFCEAALTKEA